jgi:hypothetical protein
MSKNLMTALQVKKAAKKKMMAKGGKVEKELDCVSRPDTGWGAVICKAEGGMVEQPDQPRYENISDAIRAKKRNKPADMDELVYSPEVVEASLDDTLGEEEFKSDEKLDRVGQIRKKIMAKRGMR